MEKTNTGEPRPQRGALSSAELQALAYSRTKHGRFWKAELRRSSGGSRLRRIAERPSGLAAWLAQWIRPEMGLDGFHLDHAIKDQSNG